MCLEPSGQVGDAGEGGQRGITRDLVDSSNSNYSNLSVET